MNGINAMETMTMEAGNVAKMKHNEQFSPTMSMTTVMPVMPRNGTNMNLGREKLPWSQEIWNRIDQAVHDECERTKIARKFIPLYGPVAPGELIVISDTVVRDGQTLTVNESATIALVE